MILTTLASAVIGLAGSALPEVMSLVRAKQDHSQALEIAKLRASSEQLGVSLDARAREAEAAATEQAALLADADTRHSWRWIDAIYKMTRPGITWIVIIQWALVNIAEMVSLVRDQGSWLAVTVAWSEFDQAIMTAVIMFWFGHRAMMRTNGRSV